MSDKPIIDAQTLPTWTAVGFLVALLALVIAFASIYRTNIVVLATQAEVLALNKRIAELSKTEPAVPGAPAAPAQSK